MQTYALIAIYGLLVVLASIAGGMVPLLVRVTHQRMQLSLSFVAGAMLGVGLLHLVPHAYFELKSIDEVMLWAMVGFLAMFFVERFFAFHHHDISEDAPCDESGHEHHHHPKPSEAAHRHAMTWSGAAIGLSLHGLADGLALAASVQAEGASLPWTSLAGLGTFLVIFLHKPFDSMTLGTLLAAGGFTKQSRHWVNLAFALLVPVGAILFVLGLDANAAGTQRLLGIALAFSAGTFVCIASSDLLPELQFHHHDRIKLSAALLLGIGLAWSLGFFESHGHGHDHGHDHSHGRAVEEEHGHDHGPAHGDHEH